MVESSADPNPGSRELIDHPEYQKLIVVQKCFPRRVLPLFTTQRQYFICKEEVRRQEEKLSVAKVAANQALQALWQAEETYLSAELQLDPDRLAPVPRFYPEENSVFDLLGMFERMKLDEDFGLSPSGSGVTATEEDYERPIGRGSGRRPESTEF